MMVIHDDITILTKRPVLFTFKRN